jgi:hypothetical protein
MRNTERVAYEPWVVDIPGITPPTGSTKTADDLADAAIEAAMSIPILDPSISPPVMNNKRVEEARATGTQSAENAADAAQRQSLERALSPPDALGPHPMSAESTGKIAKMTAEIADIQVRLPAMEAELARARAANPSGIRTTYERTLEQNIVNSKSREQKLSGDITKLEGSAKPAADPLTRLKIQKELDAANGIMPSAIDARRHRLGRHLRAFVQGPYTGIDSVREARRVQSERGLTRKQQRRLDRHRISMGLPPVNGTGHERPILDRVPLLKTASEKEDKKSEETSYNRIARTGNILELGEGSKDFVIVQDISAEGVMYTNSDGTESELYYLDGSGQGLSRVQMDNPANLFLQTTENPPVGVLRSVPDPTSPTGFKQKWEEVNLKSEDIKGRIHQGEEWVTLGQLWSPEDAKEALKTGMDGDQLSPKKIRLDDLVFGIEGDPNTRAIVLNNKRRKDVLYHHLVWQDIRHTSSVDTRVPVFDGHNGHFVRPLTYPEQRRMSIVTQVEQSRAQAAASARQKSLGGVRPPRRRAHWWN